MSFRCRFTTSGLLMILSGHWWSPCVSFGCAWTTTSTFGQGKDEKRPPLTCFIQKVTNHWACIRSNPQHGSTRVNQVRPVCQPGLTPGPTRSRGSKEIGQSDRQEEAHPAGRPWCSNRLDRPRRALSGLADASADESRRNGATTPEGSN